MKTTDVDITVQKKHNHLDGTTYSHPSYGMIRVNRRTGGAPEPLFGAEVQSNTHMALTIEKAEVTQDLGRNWYYGYEQIVQVIMTPVQYAEMISNPNTQGIPCTVSYTKEEGKIKYKGINTQTQHVESKIEEEVTQLKERCIGISREASNILSQKGALKKSDKEDLMKLFNDLTGTISSSLPFYEKCISANIERQKMEAKAEIESYVSQAITTAGIKTLNNPEALSLLLDKREE